MWQSARIIFRVWVNLRESNVASVFHEALEVGIGDRRIIHPEAVHLDAVSGLLLCIMVVRTHGELAARDEHHPGSWPHSAA
jgi:hypothetical protein